MRFNPRIKLFEGPYDAKKDRHEWRTGGVVGLTIQQISDLLDLVVMYNSRAETEVEEGSYAAEQLLVAKRVREWIEAGPQPFDHTQQGIYQGRGDEVVWLMECYAEIANMETSASLWCYDAMEARETEETRELYGRNEKEERLLTPKEYRVFTMIEAMKKLRDAERKAEFDISYKPLHKCTGWEISKRREEVLGERKFRKSMADMFAAMAAKRKGETFEPAPEQVRVAPPKAVYVKPDQRPTGPSYDLPSPKVKIGDKLRPSIGRSAEFQYARRQIVRAELKRLRACYRSFHKSGMEGYHPHMRLRDGNKNQIREILRVIDEAYEVEVAGVMAHSGQGSLVTNQCFVGGGAGWSGFSYSCALLFRAEQPNSDPTRGPNQVHFLFNDGSIYDYHVERFVMEVEEYRELA